MNQISKFDGPYASLSNFYPAETEFEGILYPTSEHAYQAAKCAAREDAERIRMLPTPGQAKRAGRKVQMRAGWDDMKLQVMYDILWDKFTRHQDLREKLVATGEATLIEGNNWGDRFWGMDGTGENHLGKILMEIRSKLAIPVSVPPSDMEIMKDMLRRAGLKFVEGPIYAQGPDQGCRDLLLADSIIDAASVYLSFRADGSLKDIDAFAVFDPDS